MAIRVGSLAIAALMLGTAPVQKVFLGTTQIWASEVIVTLGNTTDVVLKSLFTPEQWNDPNLKKRVLVPAGVQIGATSLAFAIQTSVQADGQAGSWAGTLTLEVAGTVSGIGGSPNSGVGGNAIRANFPGKSGQKLKLLNSGTLRSGAGAGGLGGNGGAGQYPYTFREPSSGENYDRVNNSSGFYWYQQTGWIGDATTLRWGSITAGATFNSTSFSTGGWTYFRGALLHSETQETEGGNLSFLNWYGIYRSQTRQEPTSGGIAGDAGRGQGFDGAATTGAAPVAGGTNAGASGKSGDGGTWGASGQAGASGANGNAGSGTAGATGGLAGFYIDGAANVDLVNTGTVLGRLQ